ncbi:uncharacterized protein TM35_000122930, partial [Trypanosoma theileri]
DIFFENKENVCLAVLRIFCAALSVFNSCIRGKGIPNAKVVAAWGNIQTRLEAHLEMDRTPNATALVEIPVRGQFRRGMHSKRSRHSNGRTQTQPLCAPHQTREHAWAGVSGMLRSGGARGALLRPEALNLEA